MPPSLYRLVARSIRSSGVPIVWDIDDAVWLGRRGAESMAIDMCAVADHVVAGNRLLGEWAHRNGARSVTLVPTCFDPGVEPVIASSADGLRVVWVGSPATARLVEPFGVDLQRALDAVPTMSIEFVGGSPPTALRGRSRVITTRWSPEAERRALTDADFGLALQDRTDYADHKCGFKVVQYLAYGVVPIVSDGPVHRDILGGHGLLVDRSDTTAIVDRLGTPPSESDRRAIVEHWRRNYSVACAVDRWSQVLAAVERRRDV